MKRILLALVAITSTAHAGDKGKADALFKHGKKLMDEKKYADACEAFEQSMKLDPQIGTELNVGRCCRAICSGIYSVRALLGPKNSGMIVNSGRLAARRRSMTGNSSLAGEPARSFASMPEEWSSDTGSTFCPRRAQSRAASWRRASVAAGSSEPLSTSRVRGPAGMNGFRVPIPRR